MRGIVKSFHGTRAVDGVDFSCSRGEIHGLVGENGAGKSTLMKVLAGVHDPDAGQIISATERSAGSGAIPTPGMRGIGIVYQELSLLPELTVAENIVMGGVAARSRPSAGLEQNADRQQTILKGIGVEIDPDTLVGSLPMALRQMVEIGKVLSQRVRADRVRRTHGSPVAGRGRHPV